MDQLLISPAVVFNFNCLFRFASVIEMKISENKNTVNQKIRTQLKIKRLSWKYAW